MDLQSNTLTITKVQNGAQGDPGTPGTPGANGYNAATIYIYQRAASQPAAPSNNLTYTFSTGALTPTSSLGNWSQTMPANSTDPCWVGIASAISNTSSDLIETSDWVIRELVENGQDGAPGTDGRSITGVVEQYAINNSNTTPPAESSSDWGTSQISPTSSQRYLWNREVISYSSGNPTITTPHIAGMYSEDGADGRGISSIVNTYAINNDSSTEPTSGWDTTPMAPTSSNKYLWNREVITYTSGTPSTVTTTRVIGTYSEDGAPGLDGYNQATIYIYQRTSAQSVSAPTGYTYTFSNDSISPTLTTWQRTIPTGTDPCWVTSAVVVSRNDSNNALNFVTPTVMVQNGANGASYATVYLYKRSATANPVKPNGDVIYTFSTGAVSGSLNGWTKQIPDGTDPCYMIVAQATATAGSTTDTISSSEWSGQTKVVEDGQPGTPGAPGSDGLNQATIYLYKRIADNSSTVGPTNTITYTFSSGSITETGLNGWTRNIPAIDGNPCYVISAVAIGSGTTADILTTSWSTAVKLVEDGVDGEPGTNGNNYIKLDYYQRADRAPDALVGTYSYNFSTQELSPSISASTGWQTTIPDGNAPCWITSIIFYGNDTTENSTFNQPVKLAQNGVNGKDANQYIIRTIAEEVLKFPDQNQWEQNKRYLFSTNSFQMFGFDSKNQVPINNTQYVLVSDLTAEQFQENKTNYYTKNQQGEFIQCSINDIFDSSKDYYQRNLLYAVLDIEIKGYKFKELFKPDIDSNNLIYSKYVYTQDTINYYFGILNFYNDLVNNNLANKFSDNKYTLISITSTDFYNHESSYYTYNDQTHIYTQCQSGDVFVEGKDYYIDSTNDIISIFLDCFDNKNDFDFRVYGEVIDLDDNITNIEKFIMVKNGLNDEMLDFSITAGGVYAAIQGKKLTFDGEGLTILNNGFKIEVGNENEDKEIIFYIDPLSQQLVMNGSGTFTGTVHATDGIFEGSINASTGSIGGFVVNNNSIVSKTQKLQLYSQTDLDLGVLEQGGISNGSGDPAWGNVDSTVRIRTQGYINIQSGHSYTFKIDNPYELINIDQTTFNAHKDYYYIYDDVDNKYVQCEESSIFDSEINYYIAYQLIVRNYSGTTPETHTTSDGWFTFPYIYTIPNNANYIRLLFRKSNEGTISPNSIQNLQSYEDMSLINADNIYIGDNGIVDGCLKIGNLSLINPSKSNEGIVLNLQVPGEDPYFRLTNNGYIEGQNWSIKKEADNEYVVARFGKLIVEDGQFTGTIIAKDGSFSGSITSSIINASTINTANFVTEKTRSMGGSFVFKPTFEILDIEDTVTSGQLEVTLSENSISYIPESRGQDIDIIIALSGEDIQYGKLISNIDNTLILEFCSVDYQTILSQKDIYNTATILGYGNHNDVLIGINSDNIRDGNILPPRSMVMETFTGLQDDNGTGRLDYNLKLLLGDLSTLKDKDSSFNYVEGYGLYSDNVYLNGSLMTRNGQGSFAGINTFKTVDFNYGVWGGTNIDNYTNEKIVFWGGSNSLDDNAIQQSPFIVTDKGSIFANRGEFKGTVITDSTIANAVIKTPSIYGSGSSPSLRIYDTDSTQYVEATTITQELYEQSPGKYYLYDSTNNEYTQCNSEIGFDSSKTYYEQFTNSGIGFYKTIDTEIGNADDKQTLRLSDLGFMHYINNSSGNNKGFSFIEFTDSTNSVYFYGYSFTAYTTNNDGTVNMGSSTVYRNKHIEDSAASITLDGTTSIILNYNDKHKITINNDQIFNSGGTVMNEGTTILQGAGSNNNKQLKYTINSSGYYCVYVVR